MHTLYDDITKYLDHYGTLEIKKKIKDTFDKYEIAGFFSDLYRRNSAFFGNRLIYSWFQDHFG